MTVISFLSKNFDNADTQLIYDEALTLAELHKGDDWVADRARGVAKSVDANQTPVGRYAAALALTALANEVGDLTLDNKMAVFMKANPVSEVSK